MAKSELIPFGKYKGQPIEVLAQDQQYRDWLMTQDWFRVKFQPIYTVIVNNFGEPSDTPEHNQLQARFTDAEFCRRVAWHIDSADFVQHFKYVKNEGIELKRERIALYRSDLERYHSTENQGSKTLEEWAKKRVNELEGTLAQLEAELKTIEALPVPEISAVKASAEFEVGGVDVVLSYQVSGFPRFERAYGYGSYDGRYGRAVPVECKPSLGDDYPAVLRQILASGDGRSDNNVLLVGDGGYTGTGATLEQVRTIFKSRKVRIVFLEELR